MTWLLPPAARYTTAEHGKPQTPAEKEKIQRGLAQGSLSVHWLFETAGKSRGQFVELSRADYNPNWNPPMLLF